ncbi:alpha/beta hydrolase [Biformimicrobium ophioploci]|uniref:Dot/Icm type IV secretion system effector CoxH3 n=1 Tax=Biformimicrobium ophioploci TaxID=3036711 RepID=A0ABQ6LX16_9GAMM|nr:CocE/NonD family hydrolase [Microbulbifer sp. NKW57]GMG86614.1 Dot/Icm type IV secretion system effector CoxH3 [Microbulbifer sp. NKW57]
MTDPNHATEQASKPFVQAEHKEFIPGPVGKLELVATAPKADGQFAGAGLFAVVCHPNPQGGGTMNNKVVTTLVRAYRDLGIPAVRFNCRGVGASEGQFDNGVGEADDAASVIAWARAQLPGSRLLLAGFSFGTGVATNAGFGQPDLEHLLLVAPPVSRYPYTREGRLPAPALVCMGTEDELVSHREVTEWVDQVHSPLLYKEFPGVCHFFHGHLTDLKRVASEALIQHLGA